MNDFPVLFACFAFFNCVFISTASISCESTINLQAESYNSKILTSSNYPNSLSYCRQWKISAPLGKQVQLKFTYFDTYGNPTCSKSSDDTLKIYDKSFVYMIGKYCGKYLPANVASTTGKLFLVFSSNARFGSSKKGFKLEYSAVSSKSDSSICSPFNEDHINNDIQLTATSSYKYIKSPLYPNKYPSGMECNWYITASSSSKIIKLKFTEVQISNYDSYSACSSSGKDVLTIYDGSTVYDTQLTQKCSRSYSTSTITSSGRYMVVQFKSNLDNYFDMSGGALFKLEFIEVDKDNNTAGVVAGAIFSVIIVIGLIICCACIVRRKRTAGYVQRAPAATAVAVQSTTTTTAPQYPMQAQGGPPQGHYPPPGGSYPPPAPASYPPGPPGSSYPPPVPGSYPPGPPGSSYPPPGGSYPPPYPPASDAPPQYPGPPAYPPEPHYNPQVSFQPNPPYPPQPVSSGNQQATYPPPIDNKASAPPPF